MENFKNRAEIKREKDRLRKREYAEMIKILRENGIRNKADLEFFLSEKIPF